MAGQSVADRKSIYHDAIIVSANVQHWQTVVADGQQLEALNGNDDGTYAEVAVAYYNLKDIANALTYAQKSIDMAKAAGKQPEQAALQIVMNSEAKSNNEAAAVETLETMAVNYNDPNNWHQLTQIAFGTKNLKELDALYIYRLCFSAGAMGNADDFTIMASLANQLGYPTEALKVLQQGINSGKVSSGQASGELGKARTGAAADERALASLASGAQQAKSGELAVKQAEDYWGYSRYTDAETFARTAIAKGGMKDPSEGQMILGMALVAQGKNDDAIAAFGQVSGSEGRNKAAHLWSLYAQAKKKQSGSAAAAPAPTH
jgi:tetratricopeptide (TPR) repeat protein